MKTFTLRTAAFALAATFAAGAAQAAYPERPIQLIVPWAAGGGTDSVARFLATGLEQELGKPVNVVNRPGAGGVIGHTAIARARADGYTIGLATAELATYHWMKTSPTSYKDMQAISQVNFDAAGFSVHADSPWQDVNAAFEAIKAEPGKYKLSGIPTGAAYHLALARALNDAGINPRNVVVVPSQGAAPGFQELAAGGVQMVTSAVPEGKSMRDAGIIKTLAVIADERLEAYPDIPTLGEVTGRPLSAGTWRGLIGPKGMPEEAVTRLAEATRKVTETEQFKELMGKAGFGVKWSNPADFEAFMAESDASSGELIKQLELVR